MNRMSKVSAALIAGISASMLMVSPAMARHDRGYNYDYPAQYDNQGYYNSGYDNRGSYQDRGYRGDDGYRDNYRRCNKGTGGTIIGAVAGGLLGRAVVGRRGDRTAGLIIGAGAGALAGRALDKGSNGGRC